MPLKDANSDYSCPKNAHQIAIGAPFLRQHKLYFDVFLTVTWCFTIKTCD